MWERTQAVHGRTAAAEAKVPGEYNTLTLFSIGTRALSKEAWQWRGVERLFLVSAAVLEVVTSPSLRQTDAIIIIIIIDAVVDLIQRVYSRSGHLSRSRRLDIPGNMFRLHSKQNSRTEWRTQMAGIMAGRVAVVTGAARGIGRGHALEFARQGARVVVNDLGAEVDGTGSSPGPAGEVVDQIRAAGGEAVANGEDVSDFDGARRLIEAAVAAFGDLHVLVNNAGILRDRMLVNMTADEWDAVVRVHLRGTFAPLRHAAAYWRDRSKAGADVDARVINTSSASGLYGHAGQANYGAAKAGIASLTVIAAQELARYGVTVNAVAPAALTRMTADLARGPAPAASEDAAALASLDAPEDVAPLVVWLASPAARAISGRVFNVHGGVISVAEGWHAGPAIDNHARWDDPAELDEIVPALVAKTRPNATMTGYAPGEQP